MSVRSTIRGMAKRANPAYAVGVVAIPLLGFALALTVGSVRLHTYVHVMAGVLWTGIDIFIALVVGPVLGALSVEERANWFETFTPNMTFLIPTLATVTVFGGITLAVRIGDFPNSGPWIGLFVFITFVTGTLVVEWVFEAFRRPPLAGLLRDHFPRERRLFGERSSRRRDDHPLNQHYHRHHSGGDGRAHCRGLWLPDTRRGAGVLCTTFQNPSATSIGYLRCMTRTGLWGTHDGEIVVSLTCEAPPGRRS